jgi:hypothetical protein
MCLQYCRKNIFRSFLYLFSTLYTVQYMFRVHLCCSKNKDDICCVFPLFLHLVYKVLTILPSPGGGGGWRRGRSGGRRWDGLRGWRGMVQC